MPADVQISFRGMESSPSVEAQVRRRAEGLQQFSDRVSACRVMLEAAHRRHRQGTIYHVRVDLTAPGGEVVVGRGARRGSCARGPARLDWRCIRCRPPPASGPTPARWPTKLSRRSDRPDRRVFAERDYAFLETDEGEEIYIHRNAVVDGGFDRLKVGDHVRFVVDLDEGESCQGKHRHTARHRQVMLPAEVEK